MNTKICFFEKLYWKFKYNHKKRYFTKKYSELTPRIYYDKKYHCYINPEIIDEQGDCAYICAETAKSGCLYLFVLNGEKKHAHTIDEVFLASYNYSEIFSIDKEDETQYSNQELELIKELVECGKTARKNKEESFI